MIEIPDEKYDIAIIGGNVIDVINDRIETANIGISKDRIATITKEEIKGTIVIQAKNRMVAPGFIDFHSHVDGNAFSGKCLALQGGTTTLGGERNINSKNMKLIEEEGFVVNQGLFISHSFSLRNAVGITDMYRPATEKEILVMSDLAERFLSTGIFGICFGLEFVQGTSYEEILAIAKIAKAYDRPITVHLRKDGKEALKFFDEIINIAEETGVKLHILQLMYMVGIGGAMAPALKIIDSAREKNLDITADSGVYDAYSACIGTSIFDTGWEKEYENTSVKDLLVSSGIHSGEYCTEDLFHFLRKEFPGTLVTAFVCDTDAISMALKKDYVYVSTNAADGPHYPGMGAPEVSGTYPRLIGRYVRDYKEISLMDAIKKVTLLPAKRFGLHDIGVLEAGKKADIVIFDYKTVIDCADFIGRGKPDTPPLGIEYVIINGDLVVKNGALTNNLHSGRMIKRI